jgi:hypothetical protein
MGVTASRPHKQERRQRSELVLGIPRLLAFESNHGVTGSRQAVRGGGSGAGSFKAKTPRRTHQGLLRPSARTFSSRFSSAAAFDGSYEMTFFVSPRSTERS